MMLLGTAVFAKFTNVVVTPAFINKNIKIIDIRTVEEWKETGIIKDAYTIEFFDKNGNYNVAKFKKSLDKVVKKGEQFALICRVGSRTGEVSRFLDAEFGYNVINLDGGMMKLMHDGYKPVKYRAK